MTTAPVPTRPLDSGEAPALESAWIIEPFTEGTREDYARLREALGAAGYTQEGLCDRLGLASVYDFRQVREGRPLVESLDDAQAVLTRLFLDAETVPWEVVRARLGDTLPALERLGLVHTPHSRPDECAATVLLYPTEGLWIVSDANADPDSLKVPPPPDVVYPAITRNTQRFVGLMPRERCRRFLELCSGTGIAALLAARDFAEHAWAVDITARATRFARFNAALNGIENFTALEGDLWAPVAGLTFDRIVAHPPYMPSFETAYVFRDGGEDGEQISRRIITGLPDFLEPGGDFYADCLATDRVDAPLEQRLRAMLGAAEAEFDVVLAQAQTYDPTMYYANLAKEKGTGWELVGRRQAAFARLGVERLVFGAMLLHRHVPRDRPRAAATARRQLHPYTQAADFRWLHRWAATTAEWGVDGRRVLLDATPRVSPHVQVRMTQRNRNGEWVVDGCALSTPLPFAVDANCPAWFPALLLRCDGACTGRELLAWLKAGEFVAPDATEAQLGELLEGLLVQGFLEVDECPIPEHELPAQG